MRVGDSARGAEDAQELIALAADAAEHAELFENHSPGNNGKKEKETQDAASYPAGLGEKILKVNEDKSCEQKSDVRPSVQAKFSNFSNVTHALSGINET